MVNYYTVSVSSPTHRHQAVSPSNAEQWYAVSRCNELFSFAGSFSIFTSGPPPEPLLTPS
eukprot:6853630-Pyramimonas_sp.AAC.1